MPFYPQNNWDVFLTYMLFLYLFSQENRSTCVPAEMIAPLINFEGKIVHLVVSGNAMKQGWLWEVWFLLTSFSFPSHTLSLLHSLVLFLNQIFFFDSSKGTSHALDAGWPFHIQCGHQPAGAFFTFNHSTPYSGIQHRRRRCEAAIRGQHWMSEDGLDWAEFPGDIMVPAWCCSMVVRMRELGNPEQSQVQDDPGTHWPWTPRNIHQLTAAAYVIEPATWNEKLLPFGACD